MNRFGKLLKFVCSRYIHCSSSHIYSSFFYNRIQLLSSSSVVSILCKYKTNLIDPYNKRIQYIARTNWNCSWSCCKKICWFQNVFFQNFSSLFSYYKQRMSGNSMALFLKKILEYLNNNKLVRWNWMTKMIEIRHIDVWWSHSLLQGKKGQLEFFLSTMSNYQ